VENFPPDRIIRAASLLAGWTTGPKEGLLAYLDRYDPTMNKNQYNVLYLTRGYTWYPWLMPQPLSWSGELKVSEKGGALMGVLWGGGDTFYGYLVIDYE
jgi:hypothetical protein